MEYEVNQQAENIAAHLIKPHHPHLIGLKIAYLFKQKPEGQAKPKKRKAAKAPRAGKKVTLAKACLVPKKYGELLAKDYKFVIEFDHARWDELGLEQQEALVDHELCHCGSDADGVYLKHHDLEEFRAIVERHGMWKSDIEDFAESLSKQPGLPLGASDKDVGIGVSVNRRNKRDKTKKSPQLGIN